MKRNDNYRYLYGKKKPAGRTVAYKAILLVALCVVFILIIYTDRFKSFFGADLQVKDVMKSAVGQLNKLPKITLNVDGQDYTIEAKEESEKVSSTDTAGRKFEMGKDSKLEVSFDNVPEIFNMTIYKDNVVVFSGVSTILTSEDLLGDGEYNCICEASWGSGSSKERASYQFKINADFPYELSISKSEIDPGELLVISADNLNPDETMTVETDLDFKPKSYQYGNKRIVMLPVSYYNAPGKVYQVKLIVNGEVYSYAIKLNDKAFTTQYMTIDKKVAAETRNDKSAQEVVNKIDPLKPISDNEPNWIGKFLMPVEGGRVSETDFGKRRYVNNAPTSYRHNGLDIGHDKGVPVMASNNGRILLAEFLIGTGNTVIIEHGFGLKTWYYHMDELLVKTGDKVVKGDVIGKVGSTGFSTGPHLHFSATVNNVFINPMTLINDGVPLLENE